MVGAIKTMVSLGSDVKSSYCNRRAGGSAFASTPCNDSTLAAQALGPWLEPILGVVSTPAWELLWLLSERRIECGDLLFGIEAVLSFFIP